MGQVVNQVAPAPGEAEMREGDVVLPIACPSEYARRVHCNTVQHPGDPHNCLHVCLLLRCLWGEPMVQPRGPGDETIGTIER